MRATLSAKGACIRPCLIGNCLICGSKEQWWLSWFMRNKAIREVWGGREDEWYLRQLLQQRRSCGKFHALCVFQLIGLMHVLAAFSKAFYGFRGRAGPPARVCVASSCSTGVQSCGLGSEPQAAAAQHMALCSLPAHLSGSVEVHVPTQYVRVRATVDYLHEGR